jgi:hypothetical protein
MKAIDKSTGKLVDVFKLDDNEYVRVDTDLHITYTEGELEFDNAPDYWERLYHQYAGIAMAELIKYQKQKNSNLHLFSLEELAKSCAKEASVFAMELVKKLKNN